MRYAGQIRKSGSRNGLYVKGNRPMHKIKELKNQDSYESILSDIAEFRMSTTLEEELRKNPQYQQSCESIRDIQTKLNDKRQWDIIDDVLSAHNEKNYSYGKIAYCCGFKDGLNLFVESINTSSTLTDYMNEFEKMHCT